MSSDITNKIISDRASDIANQEAQRIPLIGSYHTKVFESFANYEGKKFALRMKFDYSSRPEILSELIQIAKDSIAQSIQENVGQIVSDELQG